jgi:hypothetical protein
MKCFATSPAVAAVERPVERHHPAIRGELVAFQRLVPRRREPRRRRRAARLAVLDDRRTPDPGSATPATPRPRGRAGCCTRAPSPRAPRRVLRPRPRARRAQPPGAGFSP